MKRIPLLLAGAVAAVIVGGFALQSSRDPVPTAMAAPLAYGPDSFRAELAAADTDVSGKRKWVEKFPGEWLREERFALSLLHRFALTGQKSDLETARRMLDAGLDRAPDPAGPALSRAQLALTEHDLDGAQDALDRYGRTVVKTPESDAAATAIAGDIAFQRGDLAEALAQYRASRDLQPGFGADSRVGNALLWSGKAGEAAELTESAFRGESFAPIDHARASLMLANLAYARGDTDAAGEWVERAGKAFDGFWLVEAYEAQQLAANGEWDAAIAQMTQVAERSGQPEAMDTLAGFLRHRGRDAESAQWTRKADVAWDEKLAQSRAAYRLHAAEHHLDFGDPVRALELAREEVAARPFGEALEVLASSYIANDRPRDALAVLADAEKRGFRAVSLDMARSEALSMIGDEQGAARYLARARSINPQADGDLRTLLRFGHY